MCGLRVRGCWGFSDRAAACGFFTAPTVMGVWGGLYLKAICCVLNFEHHVCTIVRCGCKRRPACSILHNNKCLIYIYIYTHKNCDKCLSDFVYRYRYRYRY